MADVQWIKLNVGMFDGNSFKKIKKAKIGGESFRDKLTAVWFELLDFAGKSNAGGQLIESTEIPFASIEDIAILIDREPEELQLCMQYFVNNRMITVIDDIYMLTNWEKYQNTDGLEKIKEQNRKRQAKFKQKQKLLLGNVTDNVTITQGNATEEEKEIETEKEIEKEGEEINKEKVQRIAELFNTLCPSLSKVIVLSDSIKTEIATTLKQFSEDQIKTAFEKAEASSFLKGNNDRKWAATFDWLIKGENIAKVLNGNYDEKETSSFSMQGFKARCEQMPVYKQTKTAAEDETVRARAEALKQQLSTG